MTNEHDCLLISDRAVMDTAAARMATMNAPQLPLIRAAADGLVSLLWLDDPKAEWPARAVDRISRPAVVLVGDDPDPAGAAVGPNGWRCTPHLRRWARCAIVHGAAGSHEHYREAIRAALLMGRCAFVETDAAHVEPWASALGAVPVLRIVPETGCHPVAPARGDVQ